MGVDMEFESYFQDDIEKEIKTYFKKTYEIDIVYANAAYDIKNFYVLTQRLNQLMKMKMLVEGYCETTKISIEKYNEYVEQGTVLKGFPISPNLNPCKKKPIILSKVNEEIEKVTAEIHMCEAIAQEKTADFEQQKAMFTGVVFVILRKPSHMV